MTKKQDITANQNPDTVNENTVSFKLTPYFLEQNKKNIFSSVSSNANSYGIKADEHFKEAVLSSLMEKCYFKEINCIPAKGTIDTLLGTMTRNAMIDILRHEKRYVSFENFSACNEDVYEDGNGHALTSNAYSPLANVCEEDRKYFFTKAFKELDRTTTAKKKLLAFYMLTALEMTPKEIAKALLMPEKDVAVAKHRFKPRFDAIIRRLDREDYMGHKAS